jgi:acyl-CoA synthetase (AMP-forming)/AMP-acid ligase II
MITGATTVDVLVAYLGALAAGHAVLLAPDGDRLGLDLIAAYDPDVVIDAAGISGMDERRLMTSYDLHRDLALLLSTSGSTGSPKMVRLSQQNLQSNAESIAEYLGIVSSDRAVTTLPLYYSYGLSVIHSHLLAGAAIILTDLSVVDSCFWDLFREHGGTTFAGVPHTFDQLDRIGFHRMELPTLRYVTQAGGPLSPDQVLRYAELGRRSGWDLYVMYGQTEATARMAYLPPTLTTRYPNTIGQPVPGGSFTLIPVADAPSDVGELAYSGPNVMLGYAESRDDLGLGRTVHILRTGDLARQVDQVYQIVGRRSRIAKVFGLRIDLQHLETLLADHGVTAWCADAGDAVVIAVRGDMNDADRTRDLLRWQAGLPARATRVCLVAQPPRLATGKPDYRAIATLSDPTPVKVPARPNPPVRTTAHELGELYSQILNRRDVTVDSTFVSLGGDSLSYVEMSIRLEDAVGTLPANWHTTSIRDLAAASSRRTNWRMLETNVGLRAAAIIAIVGTHAQLFTLRGGAHALLAIAGYNVGRFHLTDANRRARIRHILTSIGRIVIPSVVWIAAVAALTGNYTITNVVLLDTVLGSDEWSTRRHFWFVEALVYILVALVLLLTIPALDRAERGWPFWFPITLVGMGLLTRYGLANGQETRLGDAHVIFWLFALGWACAKATSGWHRLLLTVVTSVTVTGFFDAPVRDGVVIGALLLLVWVPVVAIPAPLARLVGVLAGGSLYIYLTHWQIYPYLDDYSTVLAVVASVLFGVGYWKLTSWLVPKAAGRFTSLRRDRRSTPGPNRGSPHHPEHDHVQWGTREQ